MGCFTHSAFCWFMLLKNFIVSPSMENPELSSRPKIVHSLADMDKKYTSKADLVGEVPTGPGATEPVQHNY